MNTKQRNILNNLSPGRNTAHHINGNYKPVNPPIKTFDKEKKFENQLLLRLLKLEEINAQLENLVENGTKKLIEANETNSRFLSLVAHDLRNPFCTTIGILDLLKDNLKNYDEIEIKNLINVAYNSAIRTFNLLDNLLTWSISQNKDKTFNPVKTNLRELIINEFDSFNASAVQKQITMDHSVASNLYVSVDIQMVKTIFRNLISNAIKYLNTGGNIFISATEGNQSVEIEVADNGIGMSAKTRKRLFKIDEFHSTLGTNNEQGTGLGLLFCKEFIDIHGGKIWVESEPGKGSKFKFTLPHYI